MADFLRSLAAQIIELKYMRERQPRLSWAANNVAHRYIVTTPASIPLLLDHLGEVGAPAGEDIPVEALGSPHIEHFAAQTPAHTPAHVRERYGLPPGSRLLVLVGFPEDPMLGTTREHMLDALAITIEGLAATAPVMGQAPPWALVLRPHPRSSDGLIKDLGARVEQASSQWAAQGRAAVALMDAGFGSADRIDNRSLLGP